MTTMSNATAVENTAVHQHDAEATFDEITESANKFWIEVNNYFRQLVALNPQWDDETRRNLDCGWEYGDDAPVTAADKALALREFLYFLCDACGDDKKLAEARRTIRQLVTHTVGDDMDDWLTEFCGRSNLAEQVILSMLEHSDKSNLTKKVPAGRRAKRRP
jgi:hypothetical protein